MGDQRFSKLADLVFGRPSDLGLRYRPIAGVGLVAMALIGLAALADGVHTWSAWHMYLVVRRFLVYDNGSTAFDIYHADLIRWATYWAFVIAVPVAGVIFVLWLWRARENSEVLCRALHRRAPEWIVTCWICVPAVLYVPYQFVDDVHRASRPDNRPGLRDLHLVPGSRLIGAWWGLWWAGVLAFLITQAEVGYPTGHLARPYRTYAIANSIGLAPILAAAALIIVVMRQITFWQRDRRPHRS